MKAFIALLAMGLVACVQGQEVCADAIAKIPECARTCIQDASKSVGCEPGDLKCSCDPAKQSGISTAAIGCVLQACGVEKGLEVQSAGEEVCSCAATAAPAVASSTPAPESTTAVEASETPESSAPPATATATATVPAPPKSSTYVSPSPPFPTGSSSRPAGTASAPSGTAPGASATSSSLAPSFTGAAVHAAGSFGGVLGALMFALWAV